MRLWHKDLIDVLPDMQLKEQWRECCLVAKALHEGTLNHVLVNRVKNYWSDHLYQYCGMVYDEMMKREFKADKDKLLQYASRYDIEAFGKKPIAHFKLFDCSYGNKFYAWHDFRYLRQCLYNLEEKAIAGGIPYTQWHRIVCKFGDKVPLWTDWFNERMIGD